MFMHVHVHALRRHVPLAFLTMLDNVSLTMPSSVKGSDGIIFDNADCVLVGGSLPLNVGHCMRLIRVEPVDLSAKSGVIT